MKVQLLPILVSRKKLHCVITQQIRIWTLTAVKTPTCSKGRLCYTHPLNRKATLSHLLNRKAMLHTPAQS